MRALIPLCLVAALAGCVEPQPEGPPFFWRLVSIDGQPYRATADLAFLGQREDRVVGRGPCNSFRGWVQRKPAPETLFTGLASTQNSCALLDEEVAFFEALGAMQAESRSADRLTLTGADGRRMEFVPAGPVPVAPVRIPP